MPRAFLVAREKMIDQTALQIRVRRLQCLFEHDQAFGSRLGRCGLTGGVRGPELGDLGF